MAASLSLVLPVVSSVARKAAAELVQTVTRMWGIDADRDRLERRLLAVQCLLADAEAKSETNPAVRRWMQDLNAAAYRADDVLDRFVYEARRRKVQGQGQRSVTSKVTSHFTRDNPLLFRLKVSRELKNVLHKIDELVEEMNKFGLVERAEEPQVPYRQTHSSLDESEEIYGRGDDKAVVVSLLLDQQHQQHVQVLPVIGMGGLGKTTLAKMVYNDTRVQSHFEMKLWHCVSDNFEAPSLVRSIIELATNGRCDLPDNIELLRRKLVDVVGRKRFLLILDDVWNEDEHKWEDQLKPLLCSSIGGSGSVIVVTSRSQKVASLMGTLPPHELAYLNEDDSWKLFSKKAFSKGVQETEEFVAVGRRIVNKCKGLPLALKTMGGLMSSKQAVDEWMAVADSNIGDTSRGKDSVLSVLKLSYKCLSSEMKRCFAFCAIFPKDYKMEKDVLIQLWMANHFIHGEGMIDLAQKGEFIFNELVWRSFLQDVNEASSFSGYLTTFCKMHDLMHDLAKDANEECASAAELIQGKASIKCVHHIRMSGDELIQTKPLLKRASCLRTLLTRSKYKGLKELKLKSLKALRCTEPSYSLFKYSKYIQYLDLSGSSIIRLSDSICLLYNLQSLRLDGCWGLQYLPEGLATNLRELQHIYLEGCFKLKEMPPKLSLLHNLSTLTKFIASTKDGCGMEELKDLKHLSNTLKLYGLREVKCGSKVNLYEKHNLCELLLSWKPEENDGFTDDDINHAEEIVESLVPPSHLKKLVVCGYLGREISQWMRDPQMFQCLRILIMYECGLCKDIPLVWLSPSLEILHLEQMYNITTLCKNVDVEAARYSNFPQVFPRLKQMRLNDLPNLKRWTEEPHSLLIFPQLVYLEVNVCPKLMSLPGSPLLKSLYIRMPRDVSVPLSMPLGAWPSLVRLHVGVLANVDVFLEERSGQSSNPIQSLQELSTSGDDAFTSIFNLSKLHCGLADRLAHVEELKISGLCNIVCWPVEELRYLPRLRSLHILRCKTTGKENLSSEKILPLLEKLTIEGCDLLLDIPLLPPSIRALCIVDCKGLVALPSNLGNLTKMRELSVSRCGALKALPDGMDGLTSLELLRIVDCPEIMEFPHGLLQRIPALKFLEIFDCPDLQRRCTEGGEYFDLVCSIPMADIGSVINPETEGVERPKKRFPFCGSDSHLSCIRL